MKKKLRRKAIVQKKKAISRKEKRARGEAVERSVGHPGMARELALAYLDAWSRREEEEGAGWKFQKVRQAYLIKHLYDVPKAVFPTLVEYLRPLRGALLHELLARAREVLRRFEAGEADEGGSGLASDGDGAALEAAPERAARRRARRAKRARRLLRELAGEDPEPAGPGPSAPAAPAARSAAAGRAAGPGRGPAAAAVPLEVEGGSSGSGSDSSSDDGDDGASD